MTANTPRPNEEGELFDDCPDCTSGAPASLSRAAGEPTAPSEGTDASALLDRLLAAARTAGGSESVEERVSIACERVSRWADIILDAPLPAAGESTAAAQEDVAFGMSGRAERLLNLIIEDPDEHSPGSVYTEFANQIVRLRAEVERRWTRGSAPAAAEIIALLEGLPTAADAKKPLALRITQAIPMILRLGWVITSLRAQLTAAETDAARWRAVRNTLHTCSTAPRDGYYLTTEEFVGGPLPTADEYADRLIAAGSHSTEGSPR